MCPGLRSALLSAALVWAVAAPAWAHHSFAAYDLAVTNKVSGALKEFDWNAPHSAVTVVYQDDKGQPAEVSVVTSAPNMIAKQGFTPQDFRVGSKVDMSWHPNRNGLVGGELVELKLEDGRALHGATFGMPPGAGGPPGVGGQPPGGAPGNSAPPAPPK